MASEVDSILQKVAGYIESTQPIIDRVVEDNKAFDKKAEQTIDALVSAGVVVSGAKSKLLRKLAEDHTQALLLLEKLAGVLAAQAVAAPSLGSAVVTAEKLAAVAVDPFVRSFCPEFAINQSNRSLID